MTKEMEVEPILMIILVLLELVMQVLKMKTVIMAKIQEKKFMEMNPEGKQVITLATLMETQIQEVKSVGTGPLKDLTIKEIQAQEADLVLEMEMEM